MATASIDYTDGVMDRIYPAEASRYEVRAAFIAGVEAGLERAAEETGSCDSIVDDPTLIEVGQNSAKVIAAAIRALGSEIV